MDASTDYDTPRTITQEPDADSLDMLKERRAFTAADLDGDIFTVLAYNGAGPASSPSPPLKVTTMSSPATNGPVPQRLRWWHQAGLTHCPWASRSPSTLPAGPA